ncbi:hypothetical protein D2187_30005, partial [Escherichia coli]
KGWAIFLRQKQKKLIMLPSEIMIWQPEFTDKILSRKPGAVQIKELQRLLGKKTMENELLKEAVEYGRAKKWIAHAPLLPGDG